VQVTSHVILICLLLLDAWLGEEMHGYEVEGPRPRGRPKRTWREVVREDCQARKLNKEDALDRCKWRKMIKDVRSSGWVWVGECFFWYLPTRVVPHKRPLNCCVCVCAWCMCNTVSAVAWCPSVFHWPLFCENSGSDRACFWHRGYLQLSLNYIQISP